MHFTDEVVVLRALQVVYCLFVHVGKFLHENDKKITAVNTLLQKAKENYPTHHRILIEVYNISSLAKDFY